MNTGGSIPISRQLRFAANWKMSSWLAAEVSDWLGVSGCLTLEHWCVHFSWNTRRSPSIFLCFNTPISNSTRSTEKNGFYGRKTDSHSPVSSKSVRSRHYYLAKSARSRHYYLPKSARWRHYHLAFVSTIHSCRKNERCLWHLYLSDEVVNTVGHLWCSVGVVDGMPRARFHYHLGTSRGPDNIGSRAGPGPRAVSCTWLLYMMSTSLCVWISKTMM